MADNIILRRRKGSGLNVIEAANLMSVLSQSYVKVGVPYDSNPRKTVIVRHAGQSDDEGEAEPVFAEATDLELTLAEVATMNEFGTDRIPSRPAFGIAASTGLPTLKLLARRLYISGLQGKRSAEDILDILGLKHASQIQQVIADGVEPPNADTTIYNKWSSRTLIATGQYRQNVVHRTVLLDPGRSEVKS